MLLFDSMDPPLGGFNFTANAQGDDVGADEGANRGGFDFSAPPDWSNNPFNLEAAAGSLGWGAPAPNQLFGGGPNPFALGGVGSDALEDDVGEDFDEAPVVWPGLPPSPFGRPAVHFQMKSVQPKTRPTKTKPRASEQEQPQPSALEWKTQPVGNWDVIELLMDSSPLLKVEVFCLQCLAHFTLTFSSAVKELVVLPYDSTELICGALPHNSVLQSLDMTISTPHAFAQISEAIANAQPTLTSVALDWPALSSFEGVLEEAEGLLADQIRLNQGITHLRVRSSTPIFAAIADNPRIRHVAIETGNEGQLSLLGQATQLRSLRIGWGNSKDLGGLVAQLVAHARECCLEELDLCSPAGKYVGDVPAGSNDDEEVPTISRLLRLAANLKASDSLHGCIGVVG